MERAQQQRILVQPLIRIPICNSAAADARSPAFLKSRASLLQRLFRQRAASICGAAL